MIKRHVNLQAHNTLRLASTASAYSKITSIENLLTAITLSHAEQLPIVPLGEGSNVILQNTINAHILDIQLGGIKKINEDSSHVLVEVGAGENWHQWVMHSISEQWFGLENLALIPGRVGAAPIQNIGAYGCEVASFIESVNFINLEYNNSTKLSVSTLSGEQCQFSYRDSIFKQSLMAKTVITSVIFKLNKTFKPQLSYPALQQRINRESLDTVDAKAVAQAVIAIRSEKLPDPKQLPNAGSFFKNIAINQQQLNDFLRQYPDAPHFEYQYTDNQDGLNKTGYKIPAAWLIEKCGFKGQRTGNLGMHNQQALVLINYSESNQADSLQSRAQASDVISFAENIAKAVKARFGFTLHREPQTIPAENSSNK